MSKVAGADENVQSGEATIDYQTSAAYLKNSAPLVEQGKAVVMMTWGALEITGISLEPTFPDIPTFKEVCDKTDGCETSGPRWVEGLFRAVSQCKKLPSCQQGHPTT